MTGVVFHFGAPDKLDYARRMLRKAASKGVRTLVRADANTLAQLDHALWALPATSFLPHCSLQESQAIVRRAAVLLDRSELIATYEGLMPEVLVNLDEDIPQQSDRFQRIIEIVTPDTQDRKLARIRWKSYASMGYAIDSHDLAVSREQH